MDQQGGAARNREVLNRMWAIIRDRQYDRLEEVMHEDFVQEIPQSGERIVGIDDFRKVLENLPGSSPGVGLEIASDPHIAGDAEHFVMTPTFNVVKVGGTGDELTSYVKLRYPDGSNWYVITFSSYKDGKVVKRVDFYAPCFDPPQWRAELLGKSTAAQE